VQKLSRVVSPITGQKGCDGVEYTHEIGLLPSVLAAAHFTNRQI